jgi:hypothetical protein
VPLSYEGLSAVEGVGLAKVFQIKASVAVARRMQGLFFLFRNGCRRNSGSLSSHSSDCPL